MLELGLLLLMVGALGLYLGRAVARGDRETQIWFTMRDVFWPPAYAPEIYRRARILLFIGAVMIAISRFQ
jgi:hypothetical protein